MGCFQSKVPILADTNGDEKAFQVKYLPDRILGEGEFGVVKLVHDMEAEAAAVKDGTIAEPLACKILRKGVVFKDNTLYSPTKPKVLQLECNILRTLAGQHYNLKLMGLYEAPSAIYVVTEFCAGGEMMEYVSAYYGGSSDVGASEDGLRTEDVSRIAFQLFDALSHCAKHNVIHRDIKPENVMFRKAEKGSDLRLIDFGSSTMDSEDAVFPNPAANTGEVEQSNHIKHSDGTSLIRHTTFAGSAFYISPEMFQRGYTNRTDVWSAGVALYVLAAGYPADDLQKAFNMLQSSENSEPSERIKTLQQLPNMPPDMPDTFFEMLEMCLTYRHKKRKSADQLLQCEFVRFHIEQKEESLSISEVAAAAAASISPQIGEVSSSSTSTRLRRTKSILLEGSVSRHASYLAFSKYERSISTLLATVLTREQLKDLLFEVQRFNADVINQSDDQQKLEKALPTGDGASIDSNEKTPGQHEARANRKRLQAIKISDLKDILRKLNFLDVLKMMEKLPNAATYVTFAYHIALLRQFIREDTDKLIHSAKSAAQLDNSVHRKMRRAMSTLSTRRNSNISNGEPTSLDMSGHGQFMNSPKIFNDSGGGVNSVHGNNVWDSIKNKRKKGTGITGISNGGRRKNDDLGASSHF